MGDLSPAYDRKRPSVVENGATPFLRKGHPDFSDAFVKHAERQLDPAAAATYQQLADDAHAFDPLDARQLAKHFLAAKRVVVDSAQPDAVILLCIWWEPQDASEHPVFRRH